MAKNPYIPPHLERVPTLMDRVETIRESCAQAHEHAQASEALSAKIARTIARYISEDTRTAAEIIAADIVDLRHKVGA